MMKRLLPLFLTVLLLSACGERDLPAESSLPESSAAESSAAESQAEEVSEEPSSEESTVTESAAESSAEETALTPVRTLEGDYEAMVPAQLNTQMVPRLSHGDVPYYTVLEGGKWGLIDENGTELLPCGSDNAVTLCFDGQWVYSGAIDNWDAVSAELEKTPAMPSARDTAVLRLICLPLPPAKSPRPCTASREAPISRNCCRKKPAATPFSR